MSGPSPASNEASESSRPRLVLHPLAIATSYRASLARTLDMVAFGLQAAERCPEEDHAAPWGLYMPGAFLRLELSPQPPLTFDDARPLFRRWVLSQGLRAAVDRLSPVLDAARVAGRLTQLGPQVSSADWVAIRGGEAACFDACSLKEKMGRLVCLFNESIRPAMWPDIISINKARNCLVHRSGVVASMDTSGAHGQGSKLMVSWTRPIYVFTDRDGRATEVEAPFFTETGGTLVLGDERRRSKDFAVGSTIDFSANEFIGICFTLYKFALHLAQESAARLAEVLPVA